MSKRKLLLADDSITIQKVVNLTFADEGIDVTAVGDGNAAMEKFVESTPDLVMVDVNMPGFDGYKICEIIKQDDETKHIPVILLVGSFEPFDEEEARRVGADDYLTKPFQSIRQLVGKVTALMDAADGKTVSGENVAAPTTVDNNPEAFSGDSGEIFPETASNFEDAAPSVSPRGETVQTTQIGSLPVDETQKFSAASTGEEFSRTSGQSSADDFENQREDRSKTQPLNAAELTEIYSLDDVQTDDAESSGKNVYQFAADASSKENLNSDSENPERNISGKQRFAERESFDGRQSSEQNSANGTFAYAEIDDMNLLEVPFAESDEFYDFDDETIETVKSSDDSTEDTSTYTNETETSDTEISAVETSDAVEEIEPDAEIFAQTDRIQPDDAAASSEISNHEYSRLENSQPPYSQSADSPPVNMSPEVIDAIASKVVEKFSDALVREIARETADLIVQRITQNNSSK